MNFSGKNVLVTGASRGIGSQIAKVLSSYGLKVWINFRSSEDEAKKVLDDIKNSGADAEIIGFDASDEVSFVDAVKKIVEVDGELSYLVNNAGITNDKLAIRMKLEDFDSVIKANLNSTFIGCREALKLMSKKRFGSVVNISSIISESGNVGQVNYAASKGAINSMTKSFALEGAPRGVRFNVITPGFINSDMTDQLKDEIKAEYIKKIPLGRFGDGEDIAKAVAFLLSDDSSFITGEILKVNGGMYL